MSDPGEDKALAAYRAALGGKGKRRNLAVQLIAIGSAAAAVGVVAVGAMFITGGDRASKASVSGERDPFLCETARAGRNDAEEAAIEAGKAEPPPADAPKVLYFCSPTRTEIMKRTRGRAERQMLLANAVYALEVDGKTRVIGLAARGMRYGWDGKVCEALASAATPEGVLLAGVPIDPKSC
jgi:hypothetical protein